MRIGENAYTQSRTRAILTEEQRTEIQREVESCVVELLRSPAFTADDGSTLRARESAIAFSIPLIAISQEFSTLPSSQRPARPIRVSSGEADITLPRATASGTVPRVRKRS
jgi:hypothetical protein